MSNTEEQENTFFIYLRLKSDVWFVFESACRSECFKAKTDRSCRKQQCWFCVGNLRRITKENKIISA